MEKEILPLEDNVSIAGFCAYAEQIVSLEIAGLFFIWKYRKKSCSNNMKVLEECYFSVK
jgi:hypothetical protein